MTATDAAFAVWAFLSPAVMLAIYWRGRMDGARAALRIMDRVSGGTNGD